jgi:diguanylate cyclase (GGDEF)-like protein
MIEPPNSDLDDTTVDLDDTKPRSSEGGADGVEPNGVPAAPDEANLILIAHPENRQLGKRFRVSPGTTIDIGRNKSCDLGFPEVMSLSRNHARLSYDSDGVSIEDLGSTNGSFVSDHRVQGRVALTSGDRIQLGALHFKFLRGRDVEHAYYEAIYHLMTQDGLTEIYNRRSFDEEFQREFSRSKRHHRPLSLILFDVDHFKLVNDRCGHLCGDFVLKGVATITRRLLRTEQVFARVGGDEFAIVTPETGSANAAILAEKLRTRIAGHEFDPDLLEGTVRTTCSFGVAELNETMSTADDFYSAADEALYESKNNGRNRVTVHGLPVMPKATPDDDVDRA